jgi:hypothetical protein
MLTFLLALFLFWQPPFDATFPPLVNELAFACQNGLLSAYSMQITYRPDGTYSWSVTLWPRSGEKWPDQVWPNLSTANVPCYPDACAADWFLGQLVDPGQPCVLNVYGK